MRLTVTKQTNKNEANRNNMEEAGVSFKMTRVYLPPPHPHVCLHLACLVPRVDMSTPVRIFLFRHHKACDQF